MSALKAGDKVLAALGIAAVLAGGLWWAAGALADAGANAHGTQGLVVVCQNQDGFRRVDALSSTVTYTVESEGAGEAGYNVVRIADGAVEVTEADCSNQICVKHDPISQAGEQIVCLPHGMVVEVLAHEDDATALVLN